ncbi:MAG: FG-GAP repeat protein, partial [Planctomycetes bacterium]|nr:FG-GAP repeat protein [Planctomycetota bacterium]
SDGDASDRFGVEVATDGATLVVGAFVDDTAGINAGSACAYPLTSDFIRGDLDGDGALLITDAIAILDGLFVAGAFDCPDAADANDDSLIDISDPIYTLAYLFGGGIAPPPPWSACGPDPTVDALADCVASSCP